MVDYYKPEGVLKRDPFFCAQNFGPGQSIRQQSLINSFSFFMTDEWTP